MNCIIIDDDIVVCAILQEYIARTGGLQLKHVFHNPMDALTQTQSFNTIDVIFLDMEMPQLTGVDFLKSLIHIPHVVFVSSNKDYAVQAFDFNAVDFLLKPIEYARFLKSIQKIKEKNKEQTFRLNTESNNSFFFKKKNAYFKVMQNDILWLEAHDNYTKVITAETMYLTNNTLKSFEEILPSTHFIRTHRSYIVNKLYVTRFEDTRVFLEYNAKISPIPLSKMYKEGIFTSTKSFK